MPKVINYPRASFQAAMAIAKAVYELGGTCKLDTCAHHMNMRDGGGFRSKVAAAVKFGLLSHTTGNLSHTAIYKQIHLAYNDEDRIKYMQKAFLKPQVFLGVLQRFNGNQLQVKILDKMLIMEYDVDSKVAGRVAKYLTSGAKKVGILTANNRVELPSIEVTENSSYSESEKEINKKGGPLQTSTQLPPLPSGVLANPQEYLVQVGGPGINLTVTIHELGDFQVLDVVLKRIKEKLQVKKDGGADAELLGDKNIQEVPVENREVE